MCCLRVQGQWVVRETSINESLYDIQFVNDASGFASGWGAHGSVILKTNDGGTSWNTTLIDSVIMFGIHSFSDKQTIIAGYDSRFGHAAMFVTTDGGHEWKEEYFPNSFGFYAFAFPTSTTGYVCGYNGDILQTTNSGTSWQRLETGTGIVFRGISFPSTSVGYAFGGDQFNLPDQIFKTTNAGESWDQIQDFIASRSIGAMYFRDEMTGFLVGSDYKTKECIYKTTDGGMSWMNVYSGPSKDVVIQAIDFSDNEMGFAVGSHGRTLRTTDGGESWQPVSLTTDETLLAVTTTSSGETFTVGTNGVMYSYSPASAVTASSNTSTVLEVLHSSDGIQFRLSSVSSMPVKIHLYDILGREVREISIHGNSYLLSGLPNGTYIWKYDRSDGSTCTGLIVS